MQIRVQVPDIRGAVLELRQQMALAYTDAVRTSTRAAEKFFENATEAAGLGRKLARTWQSKAYPDAGKTSLEPAGVIWSKAPEPMRAFTQGAVIRGKNGGFLAIPSAEVLKVRGVAVEGGRGKRITPGGFERATGIKLRLVKGKGRIGFLIGDRDPNRIGKRGRAGFRSVSARQAKRGVQAKPFLAFTLVPVVTLRRRIDLPGLQAQWQQLTANALARASTAAITRAQLATQTSGRFQQTRFGAARTLN